MLAHTIDLVRDARNKHVAVAACNTYNLELTRAIVAAAESLDQAIILQLDAQSILSAGEALVTATQAAARTARVHVALHLDHCSNLELLETCFKWGFTSAHADGSHLAFLDNCAFTRSAVQLATRYDATIEGELGYPAGTETIQGRITRTTRAEQLPTDPEQAHEFIDCSGAALLAVSIGNIHGYTPDPPLLDFERLAYIAHNVNIPLVLHGASGIPKVDIQRSIHLGIAKLNFSTDIRRAYIKAVAQWSTEVGADPDVRIPGQDLKDLTHAVTDAVKDTVETIIRTCRLL